VRAAGTQYQLRPKSGTWANRDRLLGFHLTVTYDGKQLGGNNIQAAVGAPDKKRFGLDEEVFLWLDSGWWVTLRNEFSRAPDVARQILGSAADEMSAITSDPLGADASILGSAVIAAVGPSYWH
jgi:RNA:NAD 2'-phosphotransferase (TPT1/KptA family)